MITYQPTDSAEAQQDEPPVTRVYGHPREEVDRVDALNCEAPAAHRVGNHLVCTTHRLEVLRAYWESDSNLVLNEVDETAGYRCGETYRAVTR